MISLFVFGHSFHRSLFLRSERSNGSWSRSVYQTIEFARHDLTASCIDQKRCHVHERFGNPRRRRGPQRALIRYGCGGSGVHTNQPIAPRRTDLLVGWWLRAQTARCRPIAKALDDFLDFLARHLPRFGHVPIREGVRRRVGLKSLPGDFDRFRLAHRQGDIHTGGRRKSNHARLAHSPVLGYNRKYMEAEARYKP